MTVLKGIDDTQFFFGYVLSTNSLYTFYSRGRQPAARLPHLTRQAFSNGTQKLHVVNINVFMIRNKYCRP